MRYVREAWNGFQVVAPVIGIASVYRWHRNEIRAGRREPVWFAKKKYRARTGGDSGA